MMKNIPVDCKKNRSELLLQEKSILRREMKVLRREVTHRTDKEKQMLGVFLASPEFLQAETIYVYASYGSEAGTYRLMQAALDEGKGVALPKVSGEDMVFYRIKSLSDLEPGAFGIPEPKTGCLKAVPQTKDCMILPGLAFDLKGNRLGYGGGYYDRYLSGYYFDNRIALAYACQVIEQVPAEETDIPVNSILTENGLYHCLREGKEE